MLNIFLLIVFKIIIIIANVKKRRGWRESSIKIYEDTTIAYWALGGQYDHIIRI